MLASVRAREKGWAFRKMGRWAMGCDYESAPATTAAMESAEYEAPCSMRRWEVKSSRSWRRYRCMYMYMYMHMHMHMQCICIGEVLEEQV